MSKDSKLLLIEDENNLLDDFYNGIPIWNIIREVFFFECHAALQGRDTGLPDFNLLKHDDIPYIKEYESFYLNPEIIGTHDVIFLTNPRKVLVQGEYYQTIIDPIFEILSSKKDCIILEEPTYVCEIRNAPQHYEPRNHEVLFTDIYEHECIDKISTNPKEVAAVSEKIMNYVNLYRKELNINFSEKIINRLVQRVLFFSFMQERITELLQKIKPKYVIAYFFPTSFKALLCYVCKKMGIPILELQHGFVSEDFPCEHHVLNNSKLKIKSDYFLSFGNLSVYKDDFSHNKNEIVNIGYAYLDMQRLRINQRRFKENQGKRKQIMVISQPISSVPFMELCDNLYNLVGNDYNIIYKQHPLDDSEPHFRNDDIVVKSNKDSIYDIYPEIDVVVGASSTAIFEAVYLGIPSIVTRFIAGSQELYPIMKEICGISMLDKVDDICELLRTMPMPDDSINKFYTRFDEKKLFKKIDECLG